VGHRRGRQRGRLRAHPRRVVEDFALWCAGAHRLHVSRETSPARCPRWRWRYSVAQCWCPARRSPDTYVVGDLCTVLECPPITRSVLVRQPAHHPARSSAASVLDQSPGRARRGLPAGRAAASCPAAAGRAHRPAAGSPAHRRELPAANQVADRIAKRSLRVRHKAERASIEVRSALP